MADIILIQFGAWLTEDNTKFVPPQETGSQLRYKLRTLNRVIHAGTGPDQSDKAALLQKAPEFSIFWQL